MMDNTLDISPIDDNEIIVTDNNNNNILPHPLSLNFSNNLLRIGSHNIQEGNDPIKQREILNFASNLCIDILGLSETNFAPSTAKLAFKHQSSYTPYFASDSDLHQGSGVGFLITSS